MAVSSSIKAVLVEGLDLLEASVKRAKSGKSGKPEFLALYDKQLADVAAARVFVTELK